MTTAPTPSAQEQFATGQDRSAHERISPSEWFASGTRRGYDLIAKRLSTPTADGARLSDLCVFERVVSGPTIETDTRWLTMLPGFPDGAYGFAQVDRLLGKKCTPRLYVEYLGQSDSDKPTGYGYSTFERADLVQAMWRAHAVRRTMVVTLDYSSLVLLELLRRQQALPTATPATIIDAVFITNGGLFADAHPHPWQTTPMLKTTIGRLSAKAAQRFPRVFDTAMRSAAMFSRSYKVSAAEIADMRHAITRRNGAAFLHDGARFVDEHHANADRWDLAAITEALGDTVAVHLAWQRAGPLRATPDHRRPRTPRPPRRRSDVPRRPPHHLRAPRPARREY